MQLAYLNLKTNMYGASTFTHSPFDGNDDVFHLTLHENIRDFHISFI